jgi:hypothetical protein
MYRFCSHLQEKIQQIENTLFLQINSGFVLISKGNFPAPDASIAQSTDSSGPLHAGIYFGAAGAISPDRQRSRPCAWK